MGMLSESHGRNVGNPERCLKSNRGQIKPTDA
jgi:hypothetical protein